MKKIFVLFLMVIFMLSGCSSTKSITDAGVGDIIEFGTYEQDDKASNGKEPIQWQVLEKKDGKILVLSKYILDCQPYDQDFRDVSWSSCTLRSWLNSDFLDEAFTKEEQSRIESAKVTADKNPKYSTYPGSDTKDKIFLLSIVEVEKYFESYSQRTGEPTEYAIDEGAYKSDEGTCSWWLRSPGDLEWRASRVYSGGKIDDTGFSVDLSPDGVRPAMWIMIE